MSPRRIIVFFPCHGLDDFPTWLDDDEADELLAAWTAAWHPRLIAASGRMPAWASVESPPGNDAEVVGIVTARCDDRLAGVLDPASSPGSRWIRRAGDRAETVRQALAALGLGEDPPAGVSVADSLPTRVADADDFHAFGLAWLLSELLARRMRSSTGLGQAGAFQATASGDVPTGFEQRVVDAARAWEAGDAAAAGAALQECFGHLEAARARYYPVDMWLVDLVLLARTTLGQRLAAELSAPVPMGIVAAGEVVEHLATSDPPLAARLRDACAAGRVAPAGGRYAETPLDACLPETIHESFLQGHHAWRKAIGTVPVTFGQTSGGWSAFLPQVLVRFGYSGVVWNLFDGTSLPDPGTSRIRWEGSGGACLDGISRTPLDARRASTILSLPEKLGTAIDHDHTAVVLFAHHAGLASRWFSDLRVVGSWTTALGTFVTPDELFRRTSGSGTLVSWEPDSYPVARPPEPPADGPGPDPVAPWIEGARAEAKRVAAGRTVLAGLCKRSPPAVPPTAADDRPRRAARGGLVSRLARGLFGAGDDRLVLEHDTLRVRINPRTGGILSLRRPADRGNRLSQQVALRTTRPAPPPGSPWEDPLERAEYAVAVADRVDRTGERTVESRGSVVDGRGRRLGSLVQRVELFPSRPLARIDLDVDLTEAVGGPDRQAFLERFLACRFAWNENDDVDVRRSIHGQSVPTGRTLLTAPAFLALESITATRVPDVVVLTGGVPWHLRSTPHTLDSILLSGDGRRGRFTLAVGIGVDRPAELAIDLLAGADPDSAPAGPRVASGAARLTWQGPVLEGGRAVGVRVGLVETSGKGGDVTVDWGFDIDSVRTSDAAGRPISGREVTLAGRTTTCFLRRWEWACLDLLFPGPARPPQ